MLNWLNTNAGAIQGISAVVVALLTVLLFATTLWYTRLTSRIAKVTEKQLNASMYPVVEITVPNRAISTSEPSVGVYVRITNKGDVPFVISKVLVVASDKEGFIGQCPVEDFHFLVLMPEKSDQKWGNIKANRALTNDPKITIWVDVSDLADVTKHSFLLDNTGRLKHFSAFDSDKVQSVVDYMVKSS